MGAAANGAELEVLSEVPVQTTAPAEVALRPQMHIWVGIAVTVLMPEPTCSLTERCCTRWQPVSRPLMGRAPER
jgi:hypothetical protein